ncbi:MAG: hypothetical protein V9E83_05455 [Baekduia sp.]
MFDLIKELTELPGPIGEEGVVLDRIEAIWREAGATTERTRIGNVIARARAAAGRSVLLVAHADELCYLRARDPPRRLPLAGQRAGLVAHDRASATGSPSASA